MTIPQKHDYIGLSERRVVKRISDNGGSSVLNLKETELRLGLPGSESPKRTSGSGVSFFGNDFKVEAMNGFSHAPLKNYGSGAKRRFCDVIKSCGTWSLSVNGRCETDLGKSDHDMFSSSGVNGVSVKDEVSKNSSQDKKNEHAIAAAPASVVQVVGWPPVRSFRKNTLATTLHKNGCIVTAMSGLGCLYVKVSMDGAPYLRKVDLNTYCNYSQLSSGLENMFSCFTIGQYGHGFSEKEHLSESRLIDLLHGSEYVLTYEDKDGDWMLVGDVPWELFIDSCKRLRIMKGSDAIGLGMADNLQHFDLTHYDELFWEKLSNAPYTQQFSIVRTAPSTVFHLAPNLAEYANLAESNFKPILAPRTMQKFKSQN